MIKIYTNLTQEKLKLEEYLEKAKKDLAKQSKEKLIISKNKNTYQFYESNGPGKRTYISKKEISKIKMLAMKYYDEKIIKNIEPEIKRLEHFIKFYNPLAINQIYDNMPECIKKFIKPYFLSDDDFANQWAEEEYKTKGIDENTVYYITENGEKVRSKSELIIANKLHAKGIKYRYEQALNIQGFGTLYPDFTILNKHAREIVFLEHFGLMDNIEYAENFVRKIYIYANAGIVIGDSLFCTFESGKYPLNTMLLDELINSVFREGNFNSNP